MTLLKNTIISCSLLISFVLTAAGCGGSSSKASAAGTMPATPSSSGTSTNSTASSVVPANATVMSNLQTAANWQAQHDANTGSSSSGTMSVVSSPSISGSARQFNTSFFNYGGELYNVSFPNDPNATNFFYDAWIYLPASANNVLNLEMDMNQVLANGNTVIYGFQCNGATLTWDYTANQGTLAKPVDAWVHSNQPCNLQSWSKEQWHHIQISYSRDDSGNVTYNSVWVDNVQEPVNATVSSVFSLHWTPALLTNFQIDGNNSGSNTVYLDKLVISRW